MSQTRLYVGNLSPKVSRQTLEQIFSSYGSLSSVWVSTNPSGFAFVQYEDQGSANNALQAVNGMKIGGNEVVVEVSGASKKISHWGDRWVLLLQNSLKVNNTALFEIRVYRECDF